MEVKKIAVYPGSFNPFTIGHLNILQKAEAIFGEGNVIIAVGVNPDKITSAANSPSAANFDPRVINIKNNLPSKKVEGFTGFLTDYIREKEQEGYHVTIVKGLRNGDDLDYEINQLRFMEDMKKDIKIIFIPCDKNFEHISSSAYRALEKVRAGTGHKYLAKEINKYYVVEKTDGYEVIEDLPKNKIDLCSQVKVFKGYLEECQAWIKVTPLIKFNVEDFKKGTLISYDREIVELVEITQHKCILKMYDKEFTVERYDAPYIWIKYRGL
jgi:pantetheine-phosphate adenylyltransferase